MVTWNITQSYGGFNWIITFLQPKEAIVMQRLNKWFYCKAVARSQVKWYLPNRYMCFCDLNTLIKFDRMTGTVERTELEDAGFQWY